MKISSIFVAFLENMNFNGGKMSNSVKSVDFLKKITLKIPHEKDTPCNFCKEFWDFKFFSDF